jgi:hypothetical protein
LRFRGLNEPLVSRVCSAENLERQVGGGYLGPIRMSNPIVELIAVAASEDGSSFMVIVHAATETMKFVGTSEVPTNWYVRQFEEHTILRGSPDDARAISITPCHFFENPQKKRAPNPTILERVKRGEVGIARELASRWFKGGRPIRKTEHLFLALLSHEREDIRDHAKAGLLLLVEALSGRTIAPSIKHKIGQICIVLGRLDPPTRSG